jgi:predicted DCC family thiol-disulfide oxidoreductase YuxK
MSPTARNEPPRRAAARDEAAIVVFDGVCNLCSRAVSFILQNDADGRARFVPMQSQLGRDLMERHGVHPSDAETFLVIKGGRAYTRSDAALEIAKDLGAWRWLRTLRVVPRPLRDWVYSSVARNRYRWFGKRAACFVPTAEQRARFLDVPHS